MADIIIQPLTAANQADLNRCDNSFTVEAELCLHAEDGRISYHCATRDALCQTVWSRNLRPPALYRQDRSRRVAGVCGRIPKILSLAVDPATPQGYGQAWVLGPTTTSPASPGQTTVETAGTEEVLVD